MWSGPLLYWSLDHAISQLPLSYTERGHNAVEGFELVGSEIRAGKHGYALNELSAQYVAETDRKGYDLVVDYVLL